MIGQSLPFVCILIISYIAIGSNLVVITSDITREETAGDQRFDKYLKSFESAKLVRKRNTFDENGNLDLHYKASTSESKLWFQFTSPTPAYLYKSTDDSKKDITHREQVQGPSRQSNDAQFIYKTVANPSSQSELLDGDSFSIDYVGCYSTWEKQYTHIRPPDLVKKYDDGQLYMTCAMNCRQMGTAMQISFVRGAECQCAPAYELNSTLKHDFYCNIPCPIKDFHQSNLNKDLPPTPCGGNQGYSVYCASGVEDCKPLLEKAALQRKELDPPEGRHDFQIPEIQFRRPVPVLEELCVSCHLGDGRHMCGRSFLFPDFDYFPTNSPEKCIDYCGSSVLYVTNGKAERERPATQFALLTWWKDQNLQLPICNCVNDDIFEIATVVEDSSECNMKCPGKPEATCGGEERGEFLFATLYCTHTEDGICVRNAGNSSTTDTTSLPSTETDDPENPCSSESEIECDDPENTTEPSTTEETSSTTESTSEPSTTEEPSSTTESTTEEHGTSDDDDPSTTETTTTTEEITTTTTTTFPTTTTTTFPTTTTTTFPTKTTTTFPTTTTTTSPTTTTTITTSSTTKAPSTTTSSVHCDIKCQKVDRHGYYWEVCAGQQGIVRCEELNKRSNSTGLAFWRCSKDGNFLTSNPDVSRCTSVWLEEKHEEVKKIERIEDADAFVNKLSEACKNARRPNSTSTYFGHEIKDITLLVGLSVSKARNFSNQSTIPELESVVDKAVDLNAFLIQYHDPWRDLPPSDKSVITTDIIHNTEEALFHLTHDIHDKDYTRIFTMNNTDTNSFLILAESLDKELTLQNKSYEFPPNTNRDEHDSYIKLPVGWDKLVQSKQVEIAAMSMDSEYISNIMPGQYENLVSSSELDGGDGNVKLINGRLMSFTVLSSATTQSRRNQNDTSVFSRPTMTFTGKGIEITFHHDIEAWGKDSQNVPRSLHDGEQPKAALGSSECVFWDTKAYTWSSTGCKIVKANRYETVCECSHLTSFAILMDVHKYVGKQLGLQILTLILCPVSEIALFASIVILSSVNGLQKFRATITKNLSLCLLVGNALVMFVLDRNYFNMTEGVCMGAAMVTHYVFLCAFMWMLVEGIQLYRMVVHVFDSGRSYIKHFGFFAYGAPLIIIAITATTGYLQGDKPYGGDVYCWLEGPYIWSFIGVVAFVITVNLIILFIALKTAYQVQQNKKHSPVFMMGRIRSFKTWLKGCFSLTVILGLTWVVGFFTLMKSPGGIIAAYIFTILNASQVMGLFIFLFNCVFNEKVRSLTRRNLSTYLPSWLSSSVSSNPGGNDGSIYGKRPLSSMKSGESIISEKGKRRVSAIRKISSPIEIEDKTNAINAVKMPNEALPTRRTSRNTKVDFAEANNTYISHIPVQRYESNGTISSVDSIPNSSASDSGHIYSDNSQSILISKARF